LSADGRYLAFDSLATNLTAAADLNGRSDVFLRDRQTGVTRRVSGFPDREANHHSHSAALSGDGRMIAFVSAATNLVDGLDANGIADDVYSLQLTTGETTRAGTGPGGSQFAASSSPSLSSDGRFLVFAASERADRGRASQVEPPAIYVRDQASGATACVSCAYGDPGGRRAAFAPHISGNGNIVAFALRTGRDAQRTDVAVYDRPASVLTVITADANARSGRPRLSADGRVVVFESWASDLLCRLRCTPEELDENLLADIFLFDRDARRFTRVSGARKAWWAPSLAPAIDAAGRTVVFSSRQPFGPEDTTVDFDLYVCDPGC
jgi:Tol biopolymer transport system component